MSDNPKPHRTVRTSSADDLTFVAERLARRLQFGSGWRPVSPSVRFANAKATIRRAEDLLSTFPEALGELLAERDFRRYDTQMAADIKQQKKAWEARDRKHDKRVGNIDQPWIDEEGRRTRSISMTRALVLTARRKLDDLREMVESLDRSPSPVNSIDYEIVSGLMVELIYACEPLSMLVGRLEFGAEPAHGDNGRILRNEHGDEIFKPTRSCVDVISEFLQNISVTGRAGGDARGEQITEQARYERKKIAEYIESSCITALITSGQKITITSIANIFNAIENDALLDHPQSAEIEHLRGNLSTKRISKMIAEGFLSLPAPKTNEKPR
jgi:hypothetical protein